jgi:glutaredoxin
MISLGLFSKKSGQLMLISVNALPITLGLFAVISFVVSNAEAKSLYKSIGANGKVIYSAHPPEGAKVQKTLEFKDLPSSQVIPDDVMVKGDEDTSDLPKGDIILYAADWCGYCRKAKAYLASKNISYQEIDIETVNGKNAFRKVGGRGIPLLFAKGERVSGYAQEAYDSLFNSP